MSEYRFEKERVRATLTLAPGTSVNGSFFVAAQTSMRQGRERVGDLLNAQPGFFRSSCTTAARCSSTARTWWPSRSTPSVSEAEQESGYAGATQRQVEMLLSTGMRVKGIVGVYSAPGHERLSDYAQEPLEFRYLVTQKNTLIINAAHIVELTELAD